MITDSDAVSRAAAVTFGYDTRHRLHSEVRTGTNSYNLTLVYDQRGNRFTKTDSVNQRRTDYFYDVGDPENPDRFTPAQYGSKNNRVLAASLYEAV